MFGRLAGYEDVNEGDRLCRDPAMQWIVGDRAISVSADSASQIGRFETQWLSRADYLENLAPSGRTLRRVYQKEVLRCRSGITDSFGGAMLRAVASGIIQSSSDSRAGGQCWQSACLRSAARADAPAKLLAGACLSDYISLTRVPGNLPRLQTNWISTWSKGSEGCGPTKSCETEMLASVVKP